MAENKELLYTMELCGRFLFHRRGGKRGQVRVLHILWERGEVSQKEMQAILNIQSGSMSELVRKMEKTGLIERTRDSKDKRHYNIKITELGIEEVKHLKKKSEEQEAVLFDALSAKEQEEMERLLKKLLKNWREDYDESFFKPHPPKFILESVTKVEKGEEDV